MIELFDDIINWNIKRIAMQKIRERNKLMGLRADGKPYKEVA